MNDFEIIFFILRSVIYEDAKSADMINAYAKKASNLPLVTKTVYGGLENKIYIDYMIRKLSAIRLKKIHNHVLLILEIGIYNIHFLETKDYATVDKLVDLTKAKNKKSTGFVNAILRAFIKDEKELAKIYETDDIKSLSIRYSFPEEITRYIYDFYGMDYTKAYLRDADRIKDISIRVNELKTNREEIKNLLVNEGFEIEDGKISPNGLIVKNPAGLVATKFFKDGLFTIQQEASMKAVEVLDPRENSKILDLCAAPGTKTTYIGEYTKNTSQIIANDISKAKNKLILENIDRLGLKNICLTNYDASTFIRDFENKFDFCLVDAPCSGLGVVGRKPEIRYNRNKETIVRLAELQREILAKAVKYVKKGGYLVYSTCTLGPLENRNNFKYLMENKDLELVQIDGQDFIEYKSFEANTDGFFISKFRKIND
ncbi:16S rRNA (cytosine(967)-C(5))-methyltransferase RsmB [uncultured Anaerococcus sp.]|uniref:16S rRNA (cytosine(967)-C(5))-methyltransferase RsmB n=1 Tax=uncultured Anaerococcus sp. TaxID=293428 RepID=UPI00288B7087|nr:16S rRNA (cytosine(967)-C(5))-methyltransferase RsmB [uncultured Anaerococcus sp.]